MRSRFSSSILCGLAAAALILAMPVSAQQVYVSGNNNLFGTLDFSLNQPGVVTPFTKIGTLSSVLYGMGYGTDGNIYGIDTNGDYYQLDPHTAKLTALGNPISTSGGVLSAVSDNNGTMYVLDGNDNLYKVDMTQPIAHPATNLGTINFISAGASNPNILADGYIVLDSSNNIYIGGTPDPNNPNPNAHDALYKIAISSGAVNATQVGDPSSDTGFDILGGGVTVNNKLYGFGGPISSSFNIFNVDPTTGAGTLDALYQLSKSPPHGYVEAALVVRGNAVPEASSFVLLSLMLGAGGGGLMLRRKRAASS
jgi:hypothetical protein